jgi:hypothetical protein
MAAATKKVVYLEQQLHIKGGEMAAATMRVDYLEQQLCLKGCEMARGATLQYQLGQLLADRDKRISHLQQAALKLAGGLALQLREALAVVHAVLLAVGAPLGDTVVLPSGLILTPTTLNNTLTREVLPQVIEAISTSSPWGRLLMEECAERRRELAI